VGDLAALLATASGRTQQAAAERVRDMVGGSAGHSRRLQTEAGRCSPGAGVLTGLARLVFGPGGAARGAALAALAELVYDHEANAAAVADAPGLVQRVATFLSGWAPALPCCVLQARAVVGFPAALASLALAERLCCAAGRCQRAALRSGAQRRGCSATSPLRATPPLRLSAKMASKQRNGPPE
jgi:hypothetical protein